MNPVNDYFLPYQRAWILDDSPMKFYEKSRRIGITYATSFRVNDKCLRRRNFTQWVTSRDELTAHEFITDYIARWAKASNAVCRGLLGDDLQVIDPERGIRAFVATYEATGSRVVSLSSTPEAFAGKGGDVLIDEADLHKDSGRVIDMALPCTTWGGQLEVLSALSVDGGPNTPFCKMGRDILENGNPMGWSFHRTTIVDAVEQGFVEKLNEVTGQHYTRDAWLAMMRAKCRTEEAWQTQYMIEPSSDGAALLSYELISGCEIPRSECRDSGQGLLFGGYDVGRKKDLGVYFELELVGDVLRQTEYRVFDRAPFRVQSEYLYSRLNNPRLARLCVDSTGMGMMLAEYAQDRFRHGHDACRIRAGPVREVPGRGGEFHGAGESRACDAASRQFRGSHDPDRVGSGDPRGSAQDPEDHDGGRKRPLRGRTRRKRPQRPLLGAGARPARERRLRRAVPVRIVRPADAGPLSKRQFQQSETGDRR